MLGCPPNAYVALVVAIIRLFHPFLSLSQCACRRPAEIGPAWPLRVASPARGLTRRRKLPRHRLDHRWNGHVMFGIGSGHHRLHKHAGQHVLVDVGQTGAASEPLTAYQESSAHDPLGRFNWRAMGDDADSKCRPSIRRVLVTFD